MNFSRRKFLAAAGVGLAGLAGGPVFAAPARRRKLDPAEAFDLEMSAYLAAHQVPGGALAVVKDGRLVHASGYGCADRESGAPVHPDSLFRIASISKPFTAVAVLKLIEQRRLEFDTRVVELLEVKPFLPGGRKADPFLAKITVRHLLQHTAGWDREKTFDPMFRSRMIASRLGVACPPLPQDIVRFMFGRTLDFEPGTGYAYSNFGYCVLGRVIEKVTGRGYADFVREQVLAPIGIRRMRLGATLAGQRAAGEARYYLESGGEGESVFPGTAKNLPVPYGAFCLEAMDAHGGWIASAVDLARFAVALDHQKPCSLLKPELMAAMAAPPPPPVSRKTDGTLQETWYGCGWGVRPVREGKVSCWHAGSLPGTYTLLVRRWDGVSWAVVFNQRSDNKKRPSEEIEGALHRAAGTVAEWPTEDLFRTL